MSTRNFKTSEREILQALSDHPDPALKSAEIQNMLKEDVSTNAVNYRLEQLSKKGAVESKMFGSSAKGWWITETGKKLLWKLNQSQSNSDSDSGDSTDQ